MRIIDLYDFAPILNNNTPLHPRKIHHVVENIKQ